MKNEIASASTAQLKVWEKGLRNGSAGGWTLGDRNALAAELDRRTRYIGVLHSKSNQELIAHYRSIVIQGHASAFGSDMREAAMNMVSLIEAELATRMAGWAAV